ncbi:MAG: amidase family protein [Rhodobacteraceae bacterium]|nr:amidase family protein [Paracoccaceae bacterium]
MSDLWKMSGFEIADAVRAKRLSAVEVTEAHLQRLSDINPAINAVVQEFPDQAMDAARAVDARIAKGEDPGVLCGVPVTTKVNIDQKGQATTNGLTLLKDNIAHVDSPVVANIRKSGGIIVGRTNTPAFSLRWFTDNDLHGRTLNPRNALITPGGSSGGAAAAVASGICAIGHGTDIAGSVRYPAYACGLHGLRPSVGRVPVYNASAPDRFIGGQIMAVSGPITRSIADIRLGLHAMSGPDPRDPWYTPAPLDQGEFPKRVGYCEAPEGMPVVEDVRAALRQASQTLTDAGWQVEQVACPPMRAAAAINAKLWMLEMTYGAPGMVAKEGNKDAMFVYEQMALDAGPVTLDDLMGILQERAGLIREWQEFLVKFPVLLCPVSGMLPFAQQSDVQSETAFADIFEAQLTQRALPTLGLPALSVATGQVGTIPVGVQLISGRYREDILLAAGADIERAGAGVTVSDPG